MVIVRHKGVTMLEGTSVLVQLFFLGVKVLKKKCIFSLVFLLFASCFLFGCDKTGQRVILMGVEETVDNNSTFTVVNETDKNRFSVSYSSNSDTNKNSSFFSFEILSASGKGESWSSYKDLNDNSVFSFTDDKNADIVFENGAYVFSGEKTIYISYDNAPTEIKNFCKAFSSNSDDNDDYSIYVNGYLLSYNI